MSADSPASILFDELGNPVGVIVDGVIYRLQVEAKDKPTSTAIRTVVPASATDVLILAANSDRLNAVIFNFSDSAIFIGLGSAPVTSNNFTYQIASQEFVQLPQNFVGEVRAMWSSATPSGQACITELTP